MTTFSPCTVGSVATRRSMRLPPCTTDMRPSCGRRRSAMSISLMIFRREMTPFWMLLGAFCISCSTPSMRYRTRELTLTGLDVDVGRAVLDRLRDQQVHEAHDGRVVLGVLCTAVRGQVGAGGVGLLLEHLRQARHLVVGAVVAVDRGREVVLLGDDDRDAHAGRGAHVVEGEHVVRVDHGQRQLVAEHVDRQHLVATAHGRGHQGDGVDVDGVLEQLDERQLREHGARLRDLPRTHLLVVDELVDPLLVTSRISGHAVERLDGHGSTQNEDLGERRHEDLLQFTRAR